MANTIKQCHVMSDTNVRDARELLATFTFTFEYLPKSAGVMAGMSPLPGGR